MLEIFRLPELLKHLGKIFLFAFDNMITMLVFRKGVGLHVFDVCAEGFDVNLSHIAVFFNELGCKRLELAHQIRDDQQLSVGVRPRPNAVYRDVEFLGNERRQLRGNRLEQ